MRNWKSLLYNLAFAANILLLFFVLAEQWVVIPSWLQVAGRMHPLLLHFPIVLLLICMVAEWLPAREQIADILNGCWLFTLNLTVFSALFGWILSREEGYAGETVTWHKWGGVVLSVFALGWYTFKNTIQRKKIILLCSSLVLGVGLFITAHQGAILTHGEDFILAPVSTQNETAPVAFKDALVFDHVIQPILQEKCISCHNSDKAKGELIMESAAALVKGGKTGLLWDTTAAEYGLLLKRVHLPANHKEHMPPKGKPQLSDEEIALLYHWIKAGSPFTGKLADLPETDSLRLLTAAIFTTASDEIYTFAPANESVIEKLNSHYRLVQPIAAGSPALEVSYFGASQFQPEQLKELLQIKDQLVGLNLNRMPITDTELEFLTNFPALERLNLANTSITDKALPVLQKLPALYEISLSGTSISTAGLLQHPLKVEKLYCWNTGVKDTDLASLEKVWGSTYLETGFQGDTILMQLNAPIIENEEPVFREPFNLKLKHFVNGVELRYTLDGSEPDSLQSPIYKPGLLIEHSTNVKTRAFKKGWISSKTSSKQFFSAGGKPDSIQLLTAPDPEYKGNGAATLLDEAKGDANFRSGKWLAVRKKPMEIWVEYKTPKNLESVAISSMVAIGSYIMPPSEIQIWGKTSNSSNWQMVARQQPKQPAKDTALHDLVYRLPIQKQAYKELKIHIKPLGALPRWHAGKGEPGWFFVDELFFE